MLASLLTNNEIKNAAGSEVEFTRLGGEGRMVEYAQVGEAPALQHRFKVQHQESGSGKNARRRSNITFRKTAMSQVDSVTPAEGRIGVTLDVPSGHLTTDALIIDLIAELVSFLATDGTGTTVLFNGTGNGAKVLRYGDL